MYQQPVGVEDDSKSRSTIFNGFSEILKSHSLSYILAQPRLFLVFQIFSICLFSYL